MMAQTLAMATTAKYKDDIKYLLRDVEGIVVNKAFFEACARAGVDPPELQTMKPKQFRRPTDEVYDEKVLQIRHEGYEKVRQEKLKRVLKEQEAVKVMVKSGIAPALVPVDEPWLVAGGNGRKVSRSEELAPETGHSAAELIEAMAKEQAEREVARQEAERAALEAALRRQARDIQRMVAGEKATAEKAAIAAAKEKEKQAERAEEEKAKLKRKKELAEKKAQQMVKEAQEREEDKKRLLKQLEVEKEEAVKEKARLVAEEKAAIKRRKEAAAEQEAIALERRRKTEAVYAAIDAKADENVAKLEAREAAVLEAQRLKQIEVEKRNQAKKEAAQLRIAQVLNAQAQKQKDKRTAYEASVAAADARRAEKAIEAEEDRVKEAKRIAENEKKLAQAYENMQFGRTQRIEKIKTKAEERGKVFGEINEAREEAHRQTCARNENKQSAIEANVNSYKRVHEVKRRQMEAKIYEEDKRVRQIMDSKKDLLFKRNVAAHDAVLRKQEIRDKLGVMKSTQNFKGLKKLTASFGFDLDAEDAANAAATKGAAGGAGEPMSPTPKSP